MSYKFNLSFYNKTPDDDTLDEQDNLIVMFPDEWAGQLGNIPFFNATIEVYKFYLESGKEDEALCVFTNFS